MGGLDNVTPAVVYYGRARGDAHTEGGAEGRHPHSGEVEVRGKGQRAKVVQTPFYPPKVKKH